MEPSVDEELYDVFTIFAGFGNRTGPLALDGARFLKLCRDCDLLDRFVDAAAVDIVFGLLRCLACVRITR
jgi:hypothetical protein